jgi:hypothetical protein
LNIAILLADGRGGADSPLRRRINFGKALHFSFRNGIGAPA